MKTKEKLFSKNDFILYFIIIFLGIIVYFFNTEKKDGKTACINYKGQVFYYDLNENKTFFIGKTLFEIKNGKIRIKKNVCPGKICVKQGFIGKVGDVVICVPENIVVKIKGKDEPDAITW
jgi:hypothetical protein